MVKRWMLSMVLAASALGLGACGSHDAHQHDAGSDGNFGTCATETRAVPYTPGMMRTSGSGAYTITLGSVSTMPVDGPVVATPAVGWETWALAISDSSGGSPSGLRVTAVAAMPDHSHPPSMADVPADGQGGYSLYVNLFMGGFWTVTFTIEPPTGASDTVVFPLCVPH